MENMSIIEEPFQPLLSSTPLTLEGLWSLRKRVPVVPVVLGLIGFILLIGIIGLAVTHRDSVRDSASEVSALRTDLTELLRATEDKLSETTAALRKVSDLRTNLTDLLQATEDKLSSASEERDLLNTSLSETNTELQKVSDLRTNLTDLLQATEDKLSETNAELQKVSDLRTNLTDLLQATEDKLSETNTELQKVSDLRTNLTDLLQATEDKLSSASEERDLLNTSLSETNAELQRLQMLSKQKKSCPAGWKMFRCTCYLFSSGSNSWDIGRQDCRSRGGDLVTVDSVELQEFLTKLIKKDTWIGLNDRDHEKTWTWCDGSPSTLRYWDKGQPDNGGGDIRWGEEDCANFIPGKEAKANWNDRRCSDSLQWICQKLP